MRHTVRPAKPRSAAGSAMMLCCVLVAAAGQISCADEWQIGEGASFEQIFDPAPSSGPSRAFRGALIMRWERKGFREFSGLQLFGGNRVAAVSDRGTLLQFTPTVRGGRLVGASDPSLSPLLDTHGKALERKDGDAESLTSDDGGGLIVAFERRPRLLLYRPPFTGTPREIELPQSVAALPKNRGIEALTRLCDGRLLILAQAARAGASNAWIGGSGGWTARRFVRTDDYSPTGATTLPDCSVLVLERRKASDGRHAFRVRRLDATTVREDGPDALQAVPYLGPLFSRDYKFEGITVAAQGAEEDLLYLISDSKPKTGTAFVAFSVSRSH